MTVGPPFGASARRAAARDVRRAAPPSIQIGSNILTHAQLFNSHNTNLLFRTLATLAFAVSLDVLFWDGKYTHAIETMALSIYRHF